MPTARSASERYSETKSLHEDDEISVDETFELNDRQSEDDGGSQDEMFSDMDLDKTGMDQGNAVVHKSITGSVSAVSTYLVVSQKINILSSSLMLTAILSLSGSQETRFWLAGPDFLA